MSKLFLVDESLSPLIAVRLRELGYSAKSVREIGLKGSDDTELVKWALDNNAAIVTGDLDFGELWYWSYRKKLGIIILRMKFYNLESQYSIIKFLHGSKILKNPRIKDSLIISTSGRYRIRTY